jgi:pimeloyl-ACP methyl ester carboxylesterase
VERIPKTGGKVHSFTIDGRRLVYEDTGGSGHAVLCVPGIGDTRAQFRFLAPKLAAAGFRVITLDPRGLGESDAVWPAYAAHDVGGDLVALIRELKLPSVSIVGNSAGAASAVWAAVEMPDAVERIVLIGPFVRDVPISFFQELLLRAGFAGPWSTWMWGAYYKTLYPSQQPADFDAYVTHLKSNLGEPGRLTALKAMLFASKAPIDRRLAEVRAKTLVVMGAKDPDYKDPAEEAGIVAGRLSGRAVMIEGAGHYPHVEFPEKTAAIIEGFLHEER